MNYREEKDSLGIKKIPADVYYGIQVARAIENFPISGLRIDKVFIETYAKIKKAAALVNNQSGNLDSIKTEAIIKAAEEVIEGKFDEQIKIDVYQAGAGTSFNMNLNEIIANRALEILGHSKGSYAIVHPNDDVNMSQSTNDTFPSAMRIAVLEYHKNLLRELYALEQVLRHKSKQFRSVIKSGRTHLQDAMPITLGQEFGAYADSIANQIHCLQKASHSLHYLSIGGTAIGTGINTPPLFSRKMVKILSSLTNSTFKKAPNLIEKTQSMTDFVQYSAVLKVFCLELIKIANDLRLMSSGPRTGLAEIELPAVQPGSSIMPGKVNPVICEALTMICFQILGNDLTISMAAQAGQLELNVMMPVIIHNLLFSIRILANGIHMLSNKCIKGITANELKCSWYFENSIALVTLITPTIGYLKAAELAKEAVATGKTFYALIEEKGLLSQKELKQLKDIKKITGS
ncbi:MAG: aspartate ammonia-lyase [Candidatus Fischerbacteria bacterium RBG_13_37_8]|uniref:Aspartate ammonia-lyase n=1 Tax=Candidatus Fischerbacteria bacterium RBG_13_37_8 TaxID=1817863 RepID=A0A1F5VRR9_9BACT|nr:MAG: aspartate ammonia-lyase [Candidatus Fischerbacteria bacterium RBG_13_37_8]